MLNIDTTSKNFTNLIKRVNNEIKNNKNINVILLDINEEKQEIVLDFKIDTSNRKYSIIFDSTYPFKPPQKFLSNDVNYFTIMKLPTDRFYNIYKKITGKKCFCCFSVMCANNWNPCYSIQRIINESNNNCKIKKIIIEKIMADAIKEKYLINDINLDQWIY
jgi:hypothetical protein